MDQPGQSAERPARLYVDGVFDCTHYGHMRLFEQCKKKFPYVHLIVGVAGDDDCARFKCKCIMSEFERSETIRHCKWVDQVICPCPWVVDMEFIDANQIDFVCHDDAPYLYGSGEDVYFFVKKIGKFMPTQRTEGVSTTGLIQRILTDADYFALKVLRNEQEISDEVRGVVRQKAAALKEAIVKVYGEKG